MAELEAISFTDRVWRMLQGRRLRAAEREVVRRTLRLIDPDPHPEEIERGSHRTAWLTGEALIEEGSVGTDMFMVLDGRVSVHVGDTVVEHMGPGEVFGEIGLLAREPRCATVRASGRVIALRIPEEVVDAPLRESLWEYAGERRFLNLPFSPISDADLRRRWWLQARHAHLRPGEFHAPAPWVFVYDGALRVEGQVLHAPAIGHGGNLQLEVPTRLALLPEP